MAKKFNFIIIITLCIVRSYAQSNDEIKNTFDNKEVAEIFKADQSDRSGIIDWTKVSPRDSLRRVRVYQLLDSGKVNTAKDYFHSSMVFQHGGDTVSSGMAIALMRKAIEIDRSINKWLLAAAIDRDLMWRGEPQIYGTQYIKQGNAAPSELSWELYKIDTTKVSDKERIEYGVETLSEQREKVTLMNKKSILDFAASAKSTSYVIKLCRKEVTRGFKSDYNVSEHEINNFRYKLMQESRYKEALAVFNLNVDLYPMSSNAYDSLGECLLRVGKVQKGLKVYKKSLELNPKNQNASKVIKEHENN